MLHEQKVSPCSCRPLGVAQPVLTVQQRRSRVCCQDLGYSKATTIKIIFSVQSPSHVRLFATATRQASLSVTNSQSMLKRISIKSVMPSDHLIFCHPLPLLPSIFPSIRVFSKESFLHIRWPKYWSFNSASVLPINIQD